MRVFVTFLLSVLGASLVEGRIVSKCELQTALVNLQDANDPRGLTPDLMAKIVCHVELASAFNTSAVTRLDRQRDRRSSGAHGSGNSSEEKSPRPDGRPVEVHSLYGLFQLSNQLVCSDGASPSPNICAMSCDELIDDNISDDLLCVSKVRETLMKNGFRARFFEELKKWFINIYRECGNKTPAYLDNCVLP
uniref:lysozyme C, milk isozyme n=1 Tax=Gasterosteus aculeatus aculeatus TaxID=481459 RepID=UPI001A9A153B|nr:lysozyme C, milk isozyme [Gasterosteus aculeatus aculeatus]